MDERAWAGAWDESWGDSWGIGLADEVGIGLAPRPPVDFLYSIGLGIIAGNVIDIRRRPERARVVKTDDSELKEMMELYSRWRKSA